MGSPKACSRATPPSGSRCNRKVLTGFCSETWKWCRALGPRDEGGTRVKFWVLSRVPSREMAGA